MMDDTYSESIITLICFDIFIIIYYLGNYIFLYICGWGFIMCPISTLLARCVSLYLIIMHWKAYDDYYK